MKDSIEAGNFVAPKWPQPQPVSRARLHRRHFALFLSFWCCVALPIAVSGWYLFERAADQFASHVGFAVRSQDMAIPVDAFAGIGSLARTSSSDTDILFEFIQSPEIVRRLEESLGLRARYSRPETDIIFAFDRRASNEKLVNYWRRMVSVHYDPSTGLIELEVRAFSRNDAFEIATEILAQSSAMINQLSAISRDDRTRYAREELDNSVERLKNARRALTAFRATTQIVDPTADVQGQMTVLVSLQQQLASTYVELDLLSQTSRKDDPRVVNLQREVEVIERRIDIERKKFGLGGNDDETFTAVLERFEELNVDLEFAQTSYLTALTTYEAGIRDAQQQSRYLATYLQPTMPDSAEYPQRITLIAIIAVFTFLIWSVACLIYYSARDRA